MADTAAFFAKKKKSGTKKKFKSFNANKIDVSSVTSTTHVDAPDVSTSEVTTSLGLSSLGGGGNDGGIGGGFSAGAKLGDGGGEWADDVVVPAAAGGNNKKWGSASGGGKIANDSATSVANSSENKVAELLDMATLQAQWNEQDDVAERLRIEETKKQLAKAKEGMEKEAERLRLEKEKKEAAANARSSGLGLGGSAAGAGGKWVPSHLRGGGSSIRGPASMDGGTGVRKVNMEDEELFPDLAAADKILAAKEEKEREGKERMAKASSGKIVAPSGWGQRPPLNLAPKSTDGGAAAPTQRKPLNLAPPSKKVDDAPAPAEVSAVMEQKESEKEKSAETSASTPVAAESSSAPVAAASVAAVTPDASTSTATADASASATPDVAAIPPEKKVLKKKKKKDLSTFKPKSSS
mmetsp:Transcript_15958/g.33511  ORF Transcript_15958/g.33511 Transcript_15958/m.33511 type:complete len:409 (+) Transcript_15958:218-1444(+)